MFKKTENIWYAGHNNMKTTVNLIHVSDFVLGYWILSYSLK